MPEKPMNQIPFAIRELYDKGIAAVQKNNLDYALSLFTTVLKQEPGFYEAREALRATQHKRAAGTRSFFKKLVGSASSLTRGQVALRNNPLEAIAIAEDALNEDPGNISAHELLASAATAADLPKTSLLSLEVAFKNKPEDRRLALQLAAALGRLGNRQRAERLYRDLLKLNPHDPEINELLKNLLAERTMRESGYSELEGGEGSFRDALKNKAEAVSLEQENRTIKDEVVVAQLITEYESRLSKEPGHLKLMRDLADLHLKNKDFDRSLGYLQQIIEVSGIQDPAILELMRNVRLARFDHLEAALDRDAEDYETRKNLVRSERESWRLEDAKRRAELNPTDLQIRYELGAIYLAAGRVGEAIVELQKAQNNPNRRIPAMNLLAQAFSRRGMNDLAARKLQEALKEKLVFDDEAKELRYQLGSVLEKLGKPDEAIEQFKVIYEQDVSYRDVMARVDAFYAAQT
jgi:tetratricopeptide (TPR) repeat protein